MLWYRWTCADGSVWFDLNQANKVESEDSAFNKASSSLPGLKKTGCSKDKYTASLT